MIVLALNAGSSSLKFGVFKAATKRKVEPLMRGLFDGLAVTPRFSAQDAAGRLLADAPLRLPGQSTGALLQELLNFLDTRLGSEQIVAVGHRIVHGGSRFISPVHLTSEVVDALDKLTPIAPLHQPASLGPVRALSELRPGLMQIGCFDTAFHSTLAPPVSRYAIPREYEEMGIKRYGFHGLSYEFIAHQLGRISPELPAKKTVVAHLGSGCSLCAMVDGKCQDTTMGFTALDGVMMATRSGAVDPGIILYLQKTCGLSIDEVETLLYRRSGLLGVSGISADMRVLLASSDPRAAAAIDLFAFSVSRAIAALANTLGGIELLVFTGGIGEHAAQVRNAICRRLDWLGVKLDPSKSHDVLSDSDSKVEVRVVATNEEMAIARQVHLTLESATGPSEAASA
ncbi:acetate/propionate family kinase [Aminobacter carboxidus]|uniref:Acetate kinase n=1 Tax=Aminobacter carboxidus TaxID=376165 RepID=A0ABR9GGL9_9HYPH|nr:acetate/propionate family kinase [Aminobacter carboxidus]MBE1202812.1 acetate/propionate family kinase [Aminobacter carboxidus]